MVNMGLSAKQEKDSRVQLVKKEVADMIMTRIPLMQSKALEQQAGTSDDFKEISAEEKEDLNRKYSMDDTLEDKICDFYDLYVEGLEEDAGPQVRKLYAEDPEKIKRKKMLVRKSEAVRIEAHSLAQLVYAQQKLVADSSDHGTILVNRSTSSKSVAGSSGKIPVSFPNGSNVDHPKQDKIKGSSAGNSSDTRALETLQSRKIKRKPEIELGDAGQFRPEKLPSVQGDDKNKSHKVQVSAAVVKSNPQPTAPSNFEQNISL